MLTGWIIYTKTQSELNHEDYEILRFLEAANKKNIDLKVFHPTEFDLLLTQDNHESIVLNGKPTPAPDFVIPRRGHLATYFSLSIIRQLQYLGSFCCNTPDSIEIVNDKLHMHQVLVHHSFPTPETMLLKFPIDVNFVKKEIGFPLIIKNICGEEGSGVFLCESENDFLNLVSSIQKNKNDTDIIAQKYISNSYGTDLRVFVVGGEVVGCIKRCSTSSFKANYSLGGHIESHELTSEIEKLSIQTANLVNLNLAGIDLLFGENNKLLVCEANSAPGFKGLEETTGKIIAEKILDYITSHL